MYSIGDVVIVKNPYANNEAGGTIALSGTFQAKIIQTWTDDEIGKRYIGELFQKEDIEASKQAGKTSFAEKKESYDPKRIYFGQFDQISQA